MDNEDKRSLARLRFERAEELVVEAENLLKNDHYKSANNRAFYSAEKAIKAALVVREKDSESHIGLIRAFNMEFIHNPSEFFNREDMSNLQSMERVRSASDYDDFYVASKTECEEQVKKARSLLEKVKKYLIAKAIL